MDMLREKLAVQAKARRTKIRGLKIACLGVWSWLDSEVRAMSSVRLLRLL